MTAFRLTLKLIIVLFVYLFCVTQGQEAKELELKVSIRGSKAEIVLYNGTRSSQLYFDTLSSSEHSVPALVTIQMRDKEGKLLANTFLSEGKWTPQVYSSHMLPRDPQMSTLSPGQSFSVKVPLKKLLYRAPTANLESFQSVKVNCKVYVAPRLSKSISAESQWVKLSYSELE